MYSGIKSSRNGYASVTYPMMEKKHQTEERIGAFRCGGGIWDTGTIKGIRNQFSHVWRQGGRQIGDIQAYMLLFSFSPKELDPHDPDSLEKAADLADATIQKIYPDHQYTLVAQKDGNSNLIHVHGTVNALNTKTLKACRGRQTSYQALREEIEEEMMQSGILIDHGENHTKSKRKIHKKRELAKIENDGYSWTEDLADRIRTALSYTTSIADLENNLEQHGVTISRKTKNNWTFVLKESKEEKFQGRKSRGDKLDPLFVPQQMRQLIEKNYRNSIRQKYINLTEQKLTKDFPSTKDSTWQMDY